MRIPKGRAIQLINKKIDEFTELENAATYDNRYDRKYHRVYYGAEQLVTDLFSKEEALEFRRNVSGAGFAVTGLSVDYMQEVYAYQEHLQRCVAHMEVYKEKIENTWETIEDEEKLVSQNDIFIVYGHDTGARFQIAHYIGRVLQLRDIMLDQDFSASSAAITEEVERQSETAGYAVILLTPDDIGGLLGAEPLMHARARQNVILEMGYFWGKLGRSRLCILKKGDIEIPSDFDGILWVEMDDAGAWREKLRTKLQAVGVLS